MGSHAQTSFDLGIRAYNNRAEGSTGELAKKEPIDEAISYFTHAAQIINSELEASVYLLKSFYFKGKYVAKTEKEKKHIYDKGKSLAEELIEKFPKSVELRYWYLVNLGSWAEIYGVLPAAREGVADILLNQSLEIINLDSTYQNGGGHFMLGAIHLKSPRIPFLLPWPSNTKAIKHLEKAFQIGNSTPSQTVYLAQALKKNGNDFKAHKLLKDLIDLPLLSDQLVESYEQQQIAKKLLADWE
tara:strand:+ start:72308 stop:73036 length:729 start_codon:yes stop_codon:yes gene_type:complete